MPLFLRLLRIGYPREKFLKRDIVKFAEFGDRLQRGESYFVFIAGNTQTRIVQNILFRMIVLFPDFRKSPGNQIYQYGVCRFQIICILEKMIHI